MGVAGGGLTYLLISTLLYQVLADSVCVPYMCLNCNASNTEECQQCFNTSAVNSANCIVSPKSCIRVVSVQLEASSFKVEEGSMLTVLCNHSLPQNLTTGFMWLQKEELMMGENNSKLVVKIKGSTKLTCTVLSPCGNFSSQTQDITIKDGSGVILLICGVSAVVVIVLLAFAMKIIIKRNEAQNEARKRQRRARMQDINSTNTVTGYW